MHVTIEPGVRLFVDIEGPGLVPDGAVMREQPTLVLLHGAQDGLIPPAHSDALAALLPGARVQHFAGAGHNDLQDFAPYLAAVRTAVRAAVAPGAPR